VEPRIFKMRGARLGTQEEREVAASTPPDVSSRKIGQLRVR
jgi:hypothetical protein